MAGGIGPNDRRRFAAVGQAVGIGFAVVGGLLLPILLGLFADNRTGRGPVFTLVGVFVGLVLAGWELVRLTRTTAALPEQPIAVDAEEIARRAEAWDAEDAARERQRERERDPDRERDRDRAARGDEE